MAYYTGRDVDVFWSTEHETCKIIEHTDFELRVLDGVVSAATSGVIAYSLGDIGETYTKFTDCTGVDVSVGAQDEDISYMGLRNQGKIEVKKDTSITVTMKKKDRKLLQLHQGKTDVDSAEDDVGGHPARWGLTELTNGAFLIQGGDIDPKSCVDFDDATVSTYGFRVILEFKGDKEGQTGDGAGLVLRNCTISDVTHTTSNEAADEETVTFTSQVKPLITNARRSSASTTAAFDVSLTTQTPLTEI
jgi:hypothetical protein